MPYSGGMNNALIVGVGDEDVLLEEWLMVLFTLVTLGHIGPGDQKSLFYHAKPRNGNHGDEA